MTVLCELVEHHVKEEEKEMFELLRESGSDLEAVAEEVNEMKVELKKEGLPNMEATLTIGESDDNEAENNGIKAKSAAGARKMPSNRARR